MNLEEKEVKVNNLLKLHGDGGESLFFDIYI